METIIDLKLGKLFQGKLSYNSPKLSAVNNKHTAIVTPFAQSDMIHTFFQGVDPKLIQVLHETLNIELKNLQKKVVQKFNL